MYLVFCRRDFDRLQEYIDKLTSEKINLQLCLEKQTDVVRRLTDENEAITARLNDLASKNETLHESTRRYEEAQVEIENKMKLLESEKESRESEVRDYQTRMKVLGNELVRLEEELLKERNELLRLKSSTSGTDAEKALRAELETVRKENMALSSKVKELEKSASFSAEMQQEMQNLRSKLNEVQNNKGRKDLPVPPMSAVLSTEAMKEHGMEQSSAISPEIKSLLPRRAWVPGIESVQEDMHETAQRIFESLDLLEEQLQKSAAVQVGPSPA